MTGNFINFVRDYFNFVNIIIVISIKMETGQNTLREFMIIIIELTSKEFNLIIVIVRVAKILWTFFLQFLKLFI